MAQLLLTGPELGTGTDLELSLQLVESRLGAWASSSNTGAYSALLLEVFGVQDADATSALQASIRGQGLGIKLEILDAPTLSGIQGAYTSAAPQGGERIYLNAAWLQTASASEIEAVLLEEIGHAIDHRLNGNVDTPGDEGEVFSARLRGLIPASSAFSEDDHRLISLNGRPVAIEAYQFTTGSVMVSGGRSFPDKSLRGTSGRRKEPCVTEKMRLSVTLPRSLYITIKLLANDRDMTVSALLHTLIDAEIRKSEALR
jgi:post-segregation antitoxin (ccd killing protein)